MNSTLEQTSYKLEINTEVKQQDAKKIIEIQVTELFDTYGYMHR